MANKIVRILDSTLRDGEQAPGASLAPEEKLRIAVQLEKLGVDMIEPGFPASGPGEFQAVRDISRKLHKVEICGFARAVKKDIDQALAATKEASRRRLHLCIPSSDIHLSFQLHKSRQEVIRIAREMVAYAKQFVERIEFSPVDASRANKEYLQEMVEAVIAEGATIINIPDTVGYALPNEFGQIFTMLRREVRGGDEVEYSAHCHNDLGLAVANSLAAIQAGAAQVEVSVNGMGERAGNCALEELVMAIETRKETLGLDTNIRTGELYATSRMVSRLMHFPIAFNKPIVGRNAFQHEAGIHQDGLLKNRRTYEIMDPELMGIPRSKIILGKHSGRHAVQHQVEQFGIQMDESQLDKLFARFKTAAEQHKIVTDEQFARLIGPASSHVMNAFSLIDVHAGTRQDRWKKLTVTVINNHTNETKICSATAEGPVDALIQSLKKAIPFELKFEDMELYSASAGEQAEAQATITISTEGRQYRGIGIHSDLLRSIGNGFVMACNLAMRDRNHTGI